MKLSIRRIVAILLVSSFLFNYFLNVSPANAAIAPSETTGTFYFTGSSDKKTILFVGKAVDGETKNIEFRYNTLPLPILQRYAGSLFKGYPNLYPYRLLAGDGKNNSLLYKAYTTSNGHLDKNGEYNGDTSTLNTVGPFLILGKKTKNDTVFTVLGLYGYAAPLGSNPQKTALADINSTNTEVRAKSGIINFSSSLFLGAFTQTFDLNTNADAIHSIASVAAGKPHVMDSLSGSDLKSQCGQLALVWDSMQKMVRDFFDPLPNAQSESNNPNWSNDQNKWSERLANGTEAKNFVTSLADTYLEGAYRDAVKNALGDAKQYSLTEVGAANAAAIATKAEEIKELAALINANQQLALEGGSPKWKCGSNYTFLTFKWNDNQLKGKPITSMADLLSDADKLVKSFEQFKATTDSSNEEAAQCTASSGSSFAFIREALCGLLVLFKTWTDDIFDTAVNWLKASLGITDGSPLTTPTDTSTTSSPTSGTP